MLPLLLLGLCCQGWVQPAQQAGLARAYRRSCRVTPCCCSTSSVTLGSWSCGYLALDSDGPTSINSPTLTLAVRPCVPEVSHWQGPNTLAVRLGTTSCRLAST